MSVLLALRDIVRVDLERGGRPTWRLLRVFFFADTIFGGSVSHTKGVFKGVSSVAFAWPGEETLLSSLDDFHPLYTSAAVIEHCNISCVKRMRNKLNF